MSDNIRQKYRRGDVIFHEGDAGDCAYIIERGAVEIFTDKDGQEMVLAVRRAGEIFGEMAIVDAEPRSASVRAIEDCEFFVLSESQLRHRLEGLDPVLRLVQKTILGRFRESIAKLNGRAPRPSPAAEEQAAAAEQVMEDYRSAIDRIKLEQQIRQGVSAGEFELHYQPIVRSEDGALAWFEGLLRWRRPGSGLVSPGVFIPVAEESGLMSELTAMILEQACERLSQPLPVGGRDHELKLSVNVSASDICDPGFPAVLRDSIESWDVDPARLSLEVTENVLIDDPATASEMLQRCRDVGVSISIDDFGTGYAGLNYLTNYPIDYVKIDKSFADDVGVDARKTDVLRAMIDLSHLLGLKVVTEGIETETQVEKLCEMGCDHLQGYFFSKPVPWDDAVRMLVSQNLRTPAAARA